MATPLDLQEQEQLDQLKAFWNQYGNLITWTLILLLTAYAGYNGWRWWQSEQAFKAAAVYDEVDKAVVAGDADKAAARFADLKDKYGRTTFAAQAALLLARAQADKGQADAARGTLSWVVDGGAGDDATRTLARLRLAGLWLDAGKADEALQVLQAEPAPGFEALRQDRRGDALMALGRTADAKAAYDAAYKAMDDRLEYRRLIEAKLTALGAAPAASEPAR